ncbi:predicted protein [Uncinocarpus reesii 1704]|uniref:Calcineurin-like phosphoesterase domain-containing protein n=1 Tax=Uncinocarpus reesii (strain UAMH 1704) TaxID=336963 RepID=C4JM16_UNCRE|nr:uncharacterized protein UREG_03874 [Uncinocarpus reesii 1704]EEP79028.1 predicted protein [Uncinocarpus reesii 1704]
MALTSLLSLRRARTPVRFQVMSDLHLEVGQQYGTFEIEPKASNLILAGDIGRLADYQPFRDFLCSVCRKFERVFLVPGNHEFFDISREQALQLVDKLQNDPELMGKLIVMNRKRVDLEDVTILGCTLYSHILPEAEEIVRTKVGDFRRIVDWTVADHLEEHARDVEWLENEIGLVRQADSNSGLKRIIVVVSHHAPLTKGTSKLSNEANPWSSAFATDLIGNKDKPAFDDVQWWIFGHTHHCSEFVHRQVKLVSNQRGYIRSNRDENEGIEVSSNFTSKKLKTWNNSSPPENAFNLEKVIEV